MHYKQGTMKKRTKYCLSFPKKGNLEITKNDTGNSYYSTALLFNCV